MVKFVANAVGFLWPRRRWFQFNLGTLLIGVTLFGVWLGYWIDPVHRLEQELSDESEDVRYEAARKLGWLGRRGRGAEGSLAAALKDDSAWVRGAAAYLVVLEPMMAAGALDELIQMIDRDDDDGYPGFIALRAIERIGPDAVPALENQRTHGADSRVRGNAALVLRRMKPAVLRRMALTDRTAIPALIALLDDPDADISARMQAAEALGTFGKDAAAAVPRLCECLLNNYYLIGSAELALEKIGEIGALDSARRSYLKAMLADDRAGNRLYAARILLLCGEPADAVLPSMIELPPRRHESSDGSGWMARLGSAVPKLVESLSHRDPRVRGFAAEALGEVGPAAKDAVPVLMNAMHACAIGTHTRRSRPATVPTCETAAA